MSGEIPVVTLDGFHVLVPSDAFNAGHVRVRPAGDVASLDALDVIEVHALGARIAEVEAAMSAVYNPSGFNVGMTCVFDDPAHVLAIDLVPRFDGDTNFLAVTGRVKVLPEVPEQTARAYRDALSPK